MPAGPWLWTSGQIPATCWPRWKTPTSAGPLGQSEPPLLPRDREMLDALEFPGDLDGPAIAERALAFLHTYFHFTPGETQAQEAEERKRRRPLFAFRRRSEADLLPAVRPLATGSGSIW